MLAHGARSELALIPPELERCYCIGQVDDPAAAGSPLLSHCPSFHGGMAPVIPGRTSIYSPELNETGAYEDHSTERCVSHAMGFAAMVEPLTRFLIKYA
eukprot:SAG11_NODE_92_length_17132_cov_10.277285_15_plen_99_part_00